MENLFQANLSENHVNLQKKLTENIKFCKLLVSDLSQTFNVVIENDRRSEFEHRTTVYSPMQAGRWGYGFTFEATSDGVTFTDGRGICLQQMGEIFGLELKNHSENEVADIKKLRELAKAKDIEILHNRDTSCGDHFLLKMNLSRNDTLLNVKIKVIIATMLGQSIVTRI